MELGNLGSLEKLAKAQVVVDFMCQLYWATGCPDIWSNIILGISLKVFWDEFNIYIERQADCLF